MPAEKLPIRKTGKAGPLLYPDDGICPYYGTGFAAGRRKHALYRAPTGQAMQLLKAGQDAAAVVAALQAACTPPAPPAKTASLLLCLQKGPALRRTRGRGFCVTPGDRLRPADIAVAGEQLWRTSRRRPTLQQQE